MIMLLIVIQKLTYAQMSAIFTCNGSHSSMMNRGAFILSLISIICFYITNNLFNNLKMPYRITDSMFSFQKLMLCVVIPCMIALVQFKLIFYFFFHKNRITNKINDSTKTITFIIHNFLTGVQFGVFDENGIAFIYLFRIYSILIITFASFLIFTLNITHDFMFSSTNILSYLIYKDNQVDVIMFYDNFLIYTIDYLFIVLIFFFNYPLFNKYKQIYDSLFTLYDSKIHEHGQPETCEKDALSSRYTTYFINFDTQSEFYYRYFYYTRFKGLNYTEVFIFKLELNRGLDSFTNIE
jgi:hypothetical protein